MFFLNVEIFHFLCQQIFWLCWTKLFSEFPVKNILSSIFESYLDTLGYAILQLYARWKYPRKFGLDALPVGYCNKYWSGRPCT